MIKELHHGANVLLAHFHYCCKGFRPFTLDWNPTETISMAEMNTKQTCFVRQTAVYVNVNGLSFPLYYIKLLPHLLIQKWQNCASRNFWTKPLTTMNIISWPSFTKNTGNLGPMSSQGSNIAGKWQNGLRVIDSQIVHCGGKGEDWLSNRVMRGCVVATAICFDLGLPHTHSA